jgi:hypothetical protein
MDVGTKELNKDRYTEYSYYFEHMARNMKAIGHTDKEQHFVQYDMFSLHQSQVNTLRSPFIGLEKPEMETKNNNSENIQAVWNGAITIGASFEKGNEASRSEAVDKCFWLLMKILGKIKKDKDNRRILDFELDGLKARVVTDLFSEHVGVRMPFKMPSQFSLDVHSDDWYELEDGDPVVPFSIVIDQGDEVKLNQGGIHTCTILPLTYEGRSATYGYVTYMGWALTGSAEDAPVWTVSRVTDSLSGTTTTAIATEGAWDDHLNLNYN